MATSKEAYCDNFITTVPVKQSLLPNRTKFISNWYVTLCLILLISCGSSTDPAKQQSQSNSYCEYNLPFSKDYILSTFSSLPVPQYQAGLSWSNPLSVNKLCHIIYGNRTNFGYKYFTWNCDRALLSQSKIEDIKYIADRHKPHFMGIAEIDLRRNEDNKDNNSNNEMSTEQLGDKFKIEGYKIILPDSWEKTRQEQ